MPSYTEGIQEEEEEVRLAAQSETWHSEDVNTIVGKH
jgi:hypothetical protein